MTTMMTSTAHPEGSYQLPHKGIHAPSQIVYLCAPSQVLVTPSKQLIRPLIGEVFSLQYITVTHEVGFLSLPQLSDADQRKLERVDHVHGQHILQLRANDTLWS